jgi:glycosyltransferase involved in cell wall biosynthesis
LPSLSENFGIAVLEAMACAVPVVVTPDVGLARTVEAAGAGLVVEGDSGAFGLALAQLVANASMRRKMGQAGLEVARNEFSWSVIARQAEALYASLGAVGG